MANFSPFDGDLSSAAACCEKPIYRLKAKFLQSFSEEFL
jgi:hypothetical protein